MSAGPLFNRKLVSLSKSEELPAANSFSVLQFNTLNDFTSGASVKKSGFICPHEVLDWNNRSKVLLAEIAGINPDVMCLEEVDHFDYFVENLEPLGFKGEFSPRPGKPDGTATFFRTSKFDGGEVVRVVFDNATQVGIVQVLTLKATSASFVFAGAHLKSDKDPEGEAIRVKQVEQLLQEAQALSTKHGNLPVIFATDLNAQSLTAGYTTKAKSADEQPKSGTFEPLAYNKVLSHELGLGSAYTALSEDGKTEPEFTTWKVRVGDYKAGEAKMTIDYIFYSKSKFKCTHLLELPTKEVIGPKALPSESYPSDHLSILAVFEFL